MDISSDEEETEPQWVPTQLESTRAVEEQHRLDTIFTTGKTCQLCNVEDQSIPDCARMLKMILELEMKYRGKMQTKVLYEIIVQKYNNTVHRRTREHLGDDGMQRRGLEPLSVQMVRLHYEDGHDESPDRLLWNTIRYQCDAMREMERTAHWQVNANDPNATKVPNLANFTPYVRLNEQLRQNIILREKLSSDKKK
jgi:hypothetical protein